MLKDESRCAVFKDESNVSAIEEDLGFDPFNDEARARFGTIDAIVDGLRVCEIKDTSRVDALGDISRSGAILDGSKVRIRKDGSRVGRIVDVSRVGAIEVGSSVGV